MCFYLVYHQKYFIVPNIWYRYDNSRLKETIKRSIKFSIATSLDKKEPRLLAISVDVEEGETVTFDSYVKEKELVILLSIPNLEVYIVDVWPSLDDYPLPSDLDGIRDRKNDLTYQDETPYDDIANKWCDFSLGTISDLFNQGIKDALKTLQGK